jgi:hypothetical protein
VTAHEWLLDQIERDRQNARAWEHDNIDDGGFYSCPATRSEPSGDLPYGEDACECGLRRRRRRELVACDAKEQIVRHHLEWQTTLHDTAEGWSEHGCTGYRMAMEWCTYRVAAMYDDRPGWTEHWGHMPVVDEPTEETS